MIRNTMNKGQRCGERQLNPKNGIILICSAEDDVCSFCGAKMKF